MTRCGRQGHWTWSAVAGALLVCAAARASTVTAEPVVGGGPSSPASTLAGVVDSLSAAATTVKPSDPDAAASALAALDLAQSELAVGRGYGALLAVRDAWLTVEPLAGVAIYGPRVEGRLGLVRAADTLASELDRARGQVERAREPPVPLAVAALARAVWREAVPYQRAAVAYADQTGLDSGIYYLELARAHANLAVWLVAAGSRLVAADGDGAPLDSGRVVALLTELNGQASAIFAPAAESSARQRAIGASARLKLAQELLSEAKDDRQGVAAAWLVAAQAARMLGAASPAPSAEDLAVRRTALRGTAFPTSLRTMVDDQLARDLAGGTEADRRRAAASLHALSVVSAAADDVVSGSLAGLAPTRGRRPVPITLLRWPYT